MANYASSTNLAILYAAIADSVSTSLATYALTVSDNWVDSKDIKGLVKGSAPALIQNAAEYKSMEFILRTLTDVYEGEMPTADWYAKEAEKLIGAYSAQHLEESSEVHPYSSNLSPSERFMERDFLSSERMEDESEKYNVDDDWDNED